MNSNDLLILLIVVVFVLWLVGFFTIGWIDRPSDYCRSRSGSAQAAPRTQITITLQVQSARC